MLLDWTGDRPNRSSPETPANNVLWPQKAADGLHELAVIAGVDGFALDSEFLCLPVPHKATRCRLCLAFSAGVRMNDTLSSVNSGAQLPEPVRPFLGWYK